MRSFSESFRAMIALAVPYPVGGYKEITPPMGNQSAEEKVFELDTDSLVTVPSER